MAYNPYLYGGFQPGYYGQPAPEPLAQVRQPQIFQPQMMPPAQMPAAGQMQPAQAASPQNSGILWVGSKQEADGYLVAPGSAVALWDSNNPVIYLRQADSTGKPSTKVYDLVERTENPPQRQAPQIDFTQFITRDELENILTERLKRPVRAAKQKEDTENGKPDF